MLRKLTVYLGCAIAFLFLVKMNLLVRIQPEDLGAIWLPSGLLLGLMLIRPVAERWPLCAVIAVASVVAETLAGRPLQTSMVFVGINLFQCILAERMLTRILGPKLRFQRPVEFAWLYVASLLAPTLGGLLAAWYLVGDGPRSAFASSFLLWMSAEALAFSLVTPVVVFARDALRLAKRHGRPKWDLEGALAAGLALVATSLTFLYTPQPGIQTFALMFVPYPFLAYCALRRTVVEVSVTSLGVAVLAVLGSALDRGPLAVLPLSGSGRVVWLQAYLYTTLVTLMVVAVQGQDMRRIGRILDRERRLLKQRATQRQRELRKVSHELETWTYSLSHDMRGYLRTISTNAVFIQDDLEGTAQPAGVNASLNRIRQSVRHLDGMIDNLMHYSRLNRVTLRRQSIDVNELVWTVIEHLRDREPDRAAEFEVRDLGTVMADAQMLGQLFSNLLENALKFSASQSVVRIEVGCVEEDGRKCFFVRDNGIGFDPSWAEAIFDPFKRVDPSVPGNGVGLSIVRRIASRHGGDAWAEGKLGEGATIWFSLEARQESMAALLI